jgi:hypothetical protein
VDGYQGLIQIAERQLADAEEAYRADPSDANQRRIWKAWSAVRQARGEQHHQNAQIERPPTSDE